ncbi:MAG: hypothetical protein GY928_01265 [Colwellia sp.]|nr:hypothetical protein [Colwellia sp.]
MKLSYIYLLMLPITLMGCGLVSEEDAGGQPEFNSPANKHFEQQVVSLIEQLTQGEQFDYQEKAIAFTTLVWMDTLTFESELRTTTLLGHQISSSLKTELVQRGGKIVEHKSAQAISMSKNASYYLTRKLDDLSQDIEVSYVLAGTMLESKGGVEINVEVVDVESHIVVSSARTFISNTYLPELNNAFIKEGKIYRGQL